MHTVTPPKSPLAVLTAVWLLLIAGCSSGRPDVEHETELAFQPLWVPVEISINSRFEVSITAGRSVTTALGVFTLRQAATASLPDPDTWLLSIQIDDRNEVHGFEIESDEQLAAIVGRNDGVWITASDRKINVRVTGSADVVVDKASSVSGLEGRSKEPCPTSADEVLVPSGIDARVIYRFTNSHLLVLVCQTSHGDLVYYGLDYNIGDILLPLTQRSDEFIAKNADWTYTLSRSNGLLILENDTRRVEYLLTHEF